MCDGGSKGDESLLWVISSMGTAAAQPVCVCVCVCVFYRGREKFKMQRCTADQGPK